MLTGPNTTMDDNENYIKKMQSLVDSVIQADQEAIEAFHSDRKRRNGFWETLKILRVEYQTEHTDFDAYAFEEWMADKYGIQLNFVDGYLGGDYQVVDEKKYLVYVLKFK
jgi:hypothetical protein